MAEETEESYVINKTYLFDSSADSCTPSGTGCITYRVSLCHEDAMEMGEYFLTEDPCWMDFDLNFGYKDPLDEKMVEYIARDLLENWKEERKEFYEQVEEDRKRMGDKFREEDYDFEEWEGEPTTDDFMDTAWEELCDICFYWPDDLKSDCIDYYEANAPEDDEDEDEDCDW